LKNFSPSHVEVKDKNKSKSDSLSFVTLFFEVSGELIMPDAEAHVKEIGSKDSAIKLSLTIDHRKLLDEAT